VACCSEGGFEVSESVAPSLDVEDVGFVWIFRPREATVPEHGKPAFRMMGSQWRRLVEVVTVV
jgi:hypothetical protein